MHGPATILILAKKKAGGGGYFDPMADAEMAMGPMDYESEEDESGEGESEGEDYGSKMKSLREAAMHLRQAADSLDMACKEGSKDEEPTEEEPMPEPVKAKKPAPAFLKPKPMKY